MTTDDNDNPGVIAFPPLIWLVSAVISALVYFFLIQLPVMSYRASLVCGRSHLRCETIMRPHVGCTSARATATPGGCRAMPPIWPNSAG